MDEPHAGQSSRPHQQRTRGPNRPGQNEGGLFLRSWIIGLSEIERCKPIRLADEYDSKVHLPEASARIREDVTHSNAFSDLVQQLSGMTRSQIQDPADPAGLRPHPHTSR